MKMKHLKSVLLATAAGITFTTIAQAQEYPELDLDLATALNEFAAQTDIEILFEPALLSQLKVPFVPKGRNVPVVLTELLGSSGLRAVEVAENVYVVRGGAVTAGAAGAQAASTDGDDPAVPENGDDAETLSAPNSNMEPAGQRPGAVEPGVLKGAIVDEATGAQLAGAILTLEGLGQTAFTNSRGEYRFPSVPAGEYRLTVDYLGLDSGSAIVSIEPNSQTVYNFDLPYKFDTVTVFGSKSASAQALNQQRAAPNASTVIAADILGSFPAETVAEALRRVSGVAFERDDDTGEGGRISVRGFNSEAISIKLNGLELQGTRVARTVDLSNVLADNVSKITIHKSLLPSLEATGSGGLVEIETRSGLDYGDNYFSASLEREQGFEKSFGNEQQVNLVGAYQFTPTFGVVSTVQYRTTDRKNLDVDIRGLVPPVTPAGYRSVATLPERFKFPFDPELPFRFLTGTNFTERKRDEKNLSVSLNFAWDIDDHTTLRFDTQYIDRKEDFITSISSQDTRPLSTEMPVPELNNEVRTRYYLSTLSPRMSLDESASKGTVTNLSFRGETNLNAWAFKYKLGYGKTKQNVQNHLVSFRFEEPAKSAPPRPVRPPAGIPSMFSALFGAFAPPPATSLTELLDPATLVTNPDDDMAATERVVGGALKVLGDGVPFLSLSEKGRNLISDPAAYYIGSSSFSGGQYPTTTLNVETSVRYSFASGIFDYVEIGGKFIQNKRKNSDSVLSSSTLISSQQLLPVRGVKTFISGLVDDAIVDQSFSDIGVKGQTVPFVRRGIGRTLFDQLSGLTEDDPNTPKNEKRFNLYDNQGDPITVEGAIAPMTITEDRLALYLQGMATFGRLEIVGGVRFEQTERVNTALYTPAIFLPGFQQVPREAFIEAGMVRFDDIGGTDETLTPSMLATWRHTEQLVVRLGYFRSTTNPDIRLIARPPQLFVNIMFPGRERVTIREPNPDLKPTIVDNFDLDIAYYFKDNPGLLRAAFFLKETSNNFTNVLFADDPADIKERALAELKPLADTYLQKVVLPDNTEYVLNRPRNGKGGSIYGVEVEAQRQLDFVPNAPDWLENIQLMANVTWTSGSFETLIQTRDESGQLVTRSLDRPFVGQSEWSGTASIGYEDKGFSGRLLYSYQSEAVTSYDARNLNGVIPDFETLDLRMSYAWGGKQGGPKYLLYLEGDNILTDAKTADVRSGTGSKNGVGSPDFFIPGLLQFNGGRTFTLGGKIIF